MVSLRHQERIFNRSRLSSMCDSRSSGGFKKGKDTATVTAEKVKAKTCMLMQRMLDLVPSVIFRSPVSGITITTYLEGVVSLLCSGRD